LRVSKQLIYCPKDILALLLFSRKQPDQPLLAGTKDSRNGNGVVPKTEVDLRRERDNEGGPYRIRTGDLRLERAMS
jgi:hypothetical protein